jgi:amino acid adenylation domain-containing protein
MNANEPSTIPADDGAAPRPETMLPPGPPAGEFSVRRSNLSESKRDLLEKRLRGQTKLAAAGLPIAPREKKDLSPLSSAQQRMWFFSELQPGSAVYNIPSALRLKGELNLPALRAALDAIVLRHEILRTRFVPEGGSPVQLVVEAGSVPLSETDLSGEPAAQREDALQRLLVEESRRPFDLGRDPVVRATLIRLGKTEQVLTLVVHHIASDLWAWGVLLREFSALYGGFAAGKPAALPPLTIQYADYAAWERSWLDSPAIEKQLAYWRQKLAGASTLLDLPTDRPRPAATSFRGAIARHSLPSAGVEALKQLSRREDATLFVTLLAAFKVLIFRLTQQPDVIVGVPTAGRNHPQTEGLIGLFVNTLAVRNDLSGDPAFHLFLHDVKTATVEALSHQDLSFDKLIEELRPMRTPGYLPLVQVMFTLQGAVNHDVALPGLESTPIDIDPGTARFDLTLVAEQKTNGLDLVLEYSTDLFEAATARRMLGQFQTLLEGIVADSRQRVSQLPILTAAERQQQLVEWNRTQVDFPRDAGLHQLFEAQAALHPQREALVAGSRRLTYRELNDRADQLACHLRKLGVERETRVAVFLTRDWEMIITLLAILKAGGAYVAMDPAYPLERLAFILQDSCAGLVATQRSLLPALPPSAGKIVVVDELPASSREIDSMSWVSSAAHDRDLAYVIYTSGSTGRPKGVAIEHRNAVALVRWAETVFSARELAGVLAGTSICFDLSIFEIFVPLSVGGKIILAENPLALPGLPAAGEVRLINTVPSVMREVLRLGIPTSVETVNLAGEPLPTDLVDQLYALPHIKVVYDLYGPTETTTYSTFTRRERGARPTIGRPIANTELYVLDRHLEPVPLGVTGELFIGGSGVARGYLDRPTLTAERFIPHPFSAQPEARLYRTGDLCRYRPDGNVDYLGRSDDQIKIRGFRIEPAEIESALRAHLGIVDAVVVASDRGTGERRLVAYVVAKPAEERECDVDFRAFLRRTLPEPMIPSAFIPVETIPRTANGKVNRSALPAEDTVRSEPTRTYLAPRDELETKLVKIWEAVLGTTPIGINDRFFDLGGHSLLAVRLAAIIERTLECRLPVAALFQASSIAELAALIRTRDQAPLQAVVPLQALGHQPPLFLAHAMGGGNLWGYANIARELGADQPVYAFKPCEPEQIAAFPTIESMAAHYLKEMRRIQPRGPYRLGGYCFGGNIAYEMARQLEAEGESVSLLALLNAWPANSGHDRITWSPRSAVKFAVNVGYWTMRWWQWPLKTRLHFLRWKAQTAVKKISRSLTWRHDRGESEIELLVDLTGVSAGERKLWQAHLQALRAYHPRPYGGKITLLRTTGYPFYSSFDHAHGWRALASDRVTVRFVPGTHETIMVDPFVASLARELRSHLQG